jgi:hypothetical protein
MKKSKPRFVKASGAPFSDEDIQLIGAELLKIAQANRIQDVCLLSKEIVFAAVEADPDHPLRRFYDWDVKRAARKHWIAWTQKIILSVRIEWKIGKYTHPVPITLSAELPRLKHGGGRKRVLTEDAMKSDPIFASAIDYRLRTVDSNIAQIEMLISVRGGRAHPKVRRLLEVMREGFNEFYADSAQAAE